MRRASQAVKAFVAACLTVSDGSDGAAAAAAPAAFLMMRDRLRRVIGGVGFDAMSRRAVAIAQREHPSFAPLDAAALFGGHTIEGGSARERDAFVISVMANIVVLLATFIGESLSRKILQDVWPQLDAADIVLAAEDEEISE